MRLPKHYAKPCGVAPVKAKKATCPICNRIFAEKAGHVSGTDFKDEPTLYCSSNCVKLGLQKSLEKYDFNR